MTLTFRRQLGADDLSYVVEFSNDLVTWTQGGVLVSSSPVSGGVALETWRSATAVSAGSHHYARLRVQR